MTASNTAPNYITQAEEEARYAGMATAANERASTRALVFAQLAVADAIERQIKVLADIAEQLKKRNEEEK